MMDLRLTFMHFMLRTLAGIQMNIWKVACDGTFLSAEFYVAQYVLC